MLTSQEMWVMMHIAKPLTCSGCESFSADRLNCSIAQVMHMAHASGSWSLAWSAVLAM